jgi:hypothetical protein
MDGNGRSINNVFVERLRCGVLRSQYICMPTPAFAAQCNSWRATASSETRGAPFFLGPARTGNLRASHCLVQKTKPLTRQRDAKLVIRRAVRFLPQ